MRTKQKAMKKDTPEEIEKYRKLGLIFKIDHSYLDKFRIINGLRYKEREFCKDKKFDTDKLSRCKKIFKKGGERSLLGIFRKYRIKKPLSQEIMDMFKEKN